MNTANAYCVWMVVLLTLVMGCQPEPKKLRVLAASSLQEAFSELGDRFRAHHPQHGISLVFAGSQTLRVQIEHGANPDVFASANGEHIEALEGSGLVEDEGVFATNTLVIAVPQGNPARIHTLGDLVNAERLVMGSEDVPIGRYTRQMLRNAGQTHGSSFGDEVMKRTISIESNVRLVRAKVAMGEADAAVIYASDVSEGVTAVAIPNDLNVRARYHVASGTHAGNPEVASLFVEFVRSQEGQDVLRSHGFGAP